MKREDGVGKEKIISNLSEKERGLIELVEQLPIDDQYKVDLLLVWRGLKPATDIAFTLREFDESGNLFSVVAGHEKTLGEIRSTLDSLELVYVEKGPRQDKSGTKEEQWFFLSRDKENAEKLMTSFEGAGASKKGADAEYGRLSGFPPSAIDAFVKIQEKGFARRHEVSIDKEGLPAEVLKEDFMPFVRFRLSVEHWQEELETAKGWAEEIRQVDPALYERVVIGRSMG